MSSFSPSPAPPLPLEMRVQNRDARLDFWRGLCLIDMVLVHLAEADVQFGEHLKILITTYTRFAAGGFVFLSGLCIGAIFLPKAIVAVRDRGNALSVYRRVWRRMVQILLVEYVSEIGLISLEILRGQRAPITHPLLFGWRLLIGREGNDLLLLYVAMLLVTPILLELIRRRLWPVAAGISAAVFIFGTSHPWFISFVPSGKFPPLLWQAVFVSGVLFAPLLRRLDVMDRKSWWTITAGLLLAFALIFQSAHNVEMGFSHAWIPLNFAKTPLSFGEFLRYLLLTLLVMQFSTLLWPRIRHLRAAGFVCLLGRNSLLIYVMHLFLQEAVTAVAYRTWNAGLWQIGYAIAMLAALGAIAYLAEWRRSASGSVVNRAARSGERPGVGDPLPTVARIV